MTGTVLRRICVTRRGLWSYQLGIYCLPDTRKRTRYFGCSCIRLPVLTLQRTGIFTVLWTKLYGLNCCSFSSSVPLSLSSPNFHRPAGYCAPQDLLWHSRTVPEQEKLGLSGLLFLGLKLSSARRADALGTRSLAQVYGKTFPASVLKSPLELPVLS